MLLLLKNSFPLQVPWVVMTLAPSMVWEASTLGHSPPWCVFSREYCPTQMYHSMDRNMKIRGSSPDKSHWHIPRLSCSSLLVVEEGLLVCLSDAEALCSLAPRAWWTSSLSTLSEASVSHFHHPWVQSIAGVGRWVDLCSIPIPLVATTYWGLYRFT